ncbi:hypothetical protein SAMN05421839_10625 [Halolactibacillus halophilus]|uniref:AAA domain-containing protein n=1 Tax=Halolactibacillus halophilus TaxID=306540 RepID=A0A1I5MPU0_9BACI|nr:hypothetical protein [Halolactibacillus halophilus]GEM02517.1 hypothetical protein HHA03_20490 [Halolactibacillus halophilus]SFP10931.1 hypothetical protein SAMN05421839_10625 [Halolactibacillus halophilus]
MIKVFCQPRKSGKTTKLIKMAHESNAIIIVNSSDQAKEVSFIAKRMGLVIPKPISVDEYISSYDKYKRYPLLVDEAQSVLNRLLKGNVQAMTITDYDETIDYDKLGYYL